MKEIKNDTHTKPLVNFCCKKHLLWIELALTEVYSKDTD
jgi:hypothetical protein